MHKENKQLFYSTIFSSVSVLHAHESTSTHACVFSASKQAAAHPGSTSECRSCVSSIIHMRYGTLMNTCCRLTRKRRTCWIKSLFLFSLNTLWSHIINNIMVEPFFILFLFYFLFNSLFDRDNGQSENCPRISYRAKFHLLSLGRRIPKQIKNISIIPCTIKSP